MPQTSQPIKTAPVFAPAAAISPAIVKTPPPITAVITAAIKCGIERPLGSLTKSVRPSARLAMTNLLSVLLFPLRQPLPVSALQQNTPNFPKLTPCNESFSSYFSPFLRIFMQITCSLCICMIFTIRQRNVPIDFFHPMILPQKTNKGDSGHRKGRLRRAGLMQYDQHYARSTRQNEHERTTKAAKPPHCCDDAPPSGTTRNRRGCTTEEARSARRRLHRR